MDALGTVFALSNMVPACYGSRSCATSYRACLHRGSCLWGWTERRHSMGHRQGFGYMPLGRGPSSSPIGFASQEDCYPTMKSETDLRAVRVRITADSSLCQSFAGMTAHPAIRNCGARLCLPRNPMTKTQLPVSPQ